MIPFDRKTTAKQRFEQLVCPHFDAMYAAAFRMTRSQADAEDLVQETCMKAYQRLDDLEQMDYQRAWLLKVLYHQFIDSQRRNDSCPLHRSVSGETGDPDHLEGNSERPDETLEREQQVRRVVEAMRCLDADDCALVAMHDVEGLRIDELCRLTNLPEGTVKAKLHRTRRKLGRLLYNEGATRPSLEVIGSTR